MKKTMVAILAAAVVIGLAGCAGGGTSSNASGAKVQLTFWHGYTEADGKVLNQLVGEFNKSQSDVEITPVTKPWGTLLDTVLPALSSHNGPQILALPPENIPTYAQKKAIQPVEDWYSASGSGAANLNTQAVATGEVGGKRYGMPLSFTPLTMFYNKTMFDKAGISVPTTWDQWVTAARALTIDSNGDGTPEQYGLALQDNQTVGNGVWASLFKSGGGDVVKNGKSVVDSSQNVSTLTFWANAVKNYKISPTGVTGANADGLFSSGKVAMTLGGPWLATVSQAAGIQYGIAPLPAGPAGIKASALAVDMTVTAQASTKEKAAAEKFFTWFYQHKNMVTWSLGSGWPALTTNVTSSQVSSNPVVAALTPQSKYGVALLPGISQTTSVLTDLDTATQKALTGGDPATLLNAAQTAMNSTLQ